MNFLQNDTKECASQVLDYLKDCASGALEEFCAIKHLQELLNKRLTEIQPKANKLYELLDNPKTVAGYTLKKYAPPTKYENYSIQTELFKKQYELSKKYDEETGIATKKKSNSNTKFSVELK